MKLYAPITLIFGFLLHLLLGLLAICLLPAKSTFFFCLGVIGIIILDYFLFVMLLFRVPYSYKGVVDFCGKRTRTVYLDEGIHWLPKFLLISASAVNLRDQTNDIPQMKVLLADPMEIITDVSLIWSVTDPFKFLEIEEDIPDKGMDKLTQSVVRAVLSGKTQEEAINAKNNGTLPKTIQEIIQEMASNWGIKVKKVLIGDFGFNAEVLSSMEGKKRTNNIVAAAKAMVEEAKRNGEELTVKEAINLILIDQGKTTKHTNDINVGGLNLNDLLGALLKKKD